MSSLTSGLFSTPQWRNFFSSLHLRPRIRVRKFTTPSPLAALAHRRLSSHADTVEPAGSEPETEKQNHPPKSQQMIQASRSGESPQHCQDQRNKCWDQRDSSVWITAKLALNNVGGELCEPPSVCDPYARAADSSAAGLAHHA